MNNNKKKITKKKMKNYFDIRQNYKVALVPKNNFV